MTSVEQGRAAFARQAWGEAFVAFAAASGEQLDAVDHERLAVCAYLVGEDERCAKGWEAAHRAALEAGDPADAARYAFWLAFCLMLRGQTAQAGGWLGRSERVIADANLDCAASGYLLIPEFLGVLEEDPSAARDLAVHATALGERFDEPDLVALATLAHGQALLAMGDLATGIARLDEVMLSVTAGDVGPVTAGIVYCAVILECMNLFDLARAAEWTGALGVWCDAQPDLVPYRGQCLVHRSQLLQATGDWPEAIKTAEAACVRLTDPPHPALGLAYYQEAELHRLVGAFEEAEIGYRRASRHGRQPMPGLALLELDRGDQVAAKASIQRALQESGAPLERPALLAAAVEILRTTGDRTGARVAADELSTTAARSSSSEMLRALANHASSSVLLGEGDPAGALSELRAAADAWRAQHMPYEGARTAVMVGLACAALGDQVAADLEFDNATAAFTELGAAPDLQRMAALTGGPVDIGATPTGSGGLPALSAREREVLALVAAGETNRDIATTLVISQHTASRHVENIFAKLGVTSRAAATAYAYKHGLL
jgi:DNA-binding NarL/FixJ family response regulator